MFNAEQREVIHYHLRELYNASMSEASGLSDDEVNLLADLAVELVIDCGYDAEDSDAFGDEMGNVAQTLLILLLARVPNLREAAINRQVTIEI